MDPVQPRYSKEEFARRGEEIFERDIRPQLQGVPARHFVLIDIETGDFEVDESELAAADRLRVRRPNGQVWMRRVGSRFATRRIRADVPVNGRNSYNFGILSSG